MISVTSAFKATPKILKLSMNNFIQSTRFNVMSFTFLLDSLNDLDFMKYCGFCTGNSLKSKFMNSLEPYNLKIINSQSNNPI